MQFNGSGLNSAPIDGSRKYLINAAADAAVLIYSDISPSIYKQGSGAAPFSLIPEFTGSAERFARGYGDFTFTTEISEIVYRHARSTAVIEVDTNLYWTRMVYGSGAALLSVDIDSLIGVTYITGEGGLIPCNVVLDGTVSKVGRGSLITGIVSELDPSAIRMGASIAAPIILTGEGEASHISETGVRYIGGAGEFSISLDALDEGMRRQTHIGSCDMYIAGIGSGSVTRHPQTSIAELNLDLTADFVVTRMGQGILEILTTPELDAGVYVRGEGQIVLPIIASGTGYRITHNTLTADFGVLTNADGAVNNWGRGEAVLSIVSELTLSKMQQISGTATIIMFETSNGYINPFTADADAFIKPAIQRNFKRISPTVIWRK